MESDLEGNTGDHDQTRAQQTPSYGNIDKTIENYWNNSSKRKLDMYSPSELLSQFKDLSLVNHHHHSASSSSYTKSQKINETSGPTQVTPMPQWTEEEQVMILRKAVLRYKEELMENKGNFQRLHKQKKRRKPNNARAQQSKEENEVIFKLVNKYGHQRWSHVTKHLPPRHGNQGREIRRRRNRLNPDIKTTWTLDEELGLIRAYRVHGDKWGELAKLLPGRSAHAIKIHWNNLWKKKADSYLASAGILSKFQDLSLLSSSLTNTST